MQRRARAERGGWRGRVIALSACCLVQVGLVGSDWGAPIEPAIAGGLALDSAARQQRPSAQSRLQALRGGSDPRAASLERAGEARRRQLSPPNARHPREDSWHPGRDGRDRDRDRAEARGERGSESRRLRVEVADKCASVLRDLGGVSDLPRLLDRWCDLFPRNRVSRDGQAVFFGDVGIQLVDAMLDSGRIISYRDQMRPNVRLFALSSANGKRPAIPLQWGPGSVGGAGGVLPTRGSPPRERDLDRDWGRGRERDGMRDGRGPPPGGWENEREFERQAERHGRAEGGVRGLYESHRGRDRGEPSRDERERGRDGWIPPAGLRDGREARLSGRRDEKERDEGGAVRESHNRDDSLNARDETLNSEEIRSEEMHDEGREGRETQKSSSVDRSRVCLPAVPGSAVAIPRHMLLHKTRLCRDFMQTGKCQFLDLCSFAHGRHELRSAQEAARHASQQSLKQQEEMARRQQLLDQIKMEHGALPVPVDPKLENVTFSSRIVRVMASVNYPDDAHFCIAESTPGNPDVFVSRKAIDDDIWKQLIDWWSSPKNSIIPMVLNITCQMHKKGTNNWRAIQVEMDPSLSVGDPVGAETEGLAGEVSGRQAKNVTGDFNPKFGYTCKITSSGKNFSFADDSIFIRNELRDQCGIKGLWVGDVVLVDATYNHMRRNWVASSVTLVQRNNTGYNLMQESITKMQAELLQAAGVPLPNTAAGGEGGDGEAPVNHKSDDAAQDAALHADEGATDEQDKDADVGPGNNVVSAEAAANKGGAQDEQSGLTEAHGAAAVSGAAEPGRSEAASTVSALVKTNPLLSDLSGALSSKEGLSSVLRDPTVLQTLISALQQQRAQQSKPADLERQNAANAAATNVAGTAEMPSTREDRMKFNFRTEMCANLIKHGHCRYGPKCMFAHTKEELRAVGSPLPPEDEAIAHQVVSAILKTQGQGGGGEDPSGKRGRDDDDEEPRGKRARSGGREEDREEPGALEKWTEEELCSGELFVCGLDRRMRSADELRKMFSKYGTVKDARLIMEPSKSGSRRQVSKGFGFVLFENPRDNLEAVKALDGTRKNGQAGRRIKVMPAESGQAAVNEENGAHDSFANDDLLNRQNMASVEGSVFEEEHLAQQAETKGNMRVCMMQGLPNYMEDNWAVLLPPETAEEASGANALAKGASSGESSTFAKQQIAYYGVFDGHNGYRCSLYAREMLLQNVHGQLADDGISVEQLTDATRQGYLKTDSDFVALGVRDGACVVTVAVTPGHLVAANAGDSRAVLAVSRPDCEERKLDSRNGSVVVAHELTSDHKPDRPDEQSRIEDLGGFVVELGVARVNGYLAVSRALGDVDLKTFVIADPEIQVVERNSSQQEFVVLATDGLWDVVSSQEAVEMIWHHWDLPDHGISNLVMHAYQVGSTDNICIMVVDLKDGTVVQSSMPAAEPESDAQAELQDSSGESHDSQSLGAQAETHQDEMRGADPEAGKEQAALEEALLGSSSLLGVGGVVAENAEINRKTEGSTKDKDSVKHSAVTKERKPRAKSVRTATSKVKAKIGEAAVAVTASAPVANKTETGIVEEGMP